MKVLMVTTDNREHNKSYDLSDPWLSPPQAAILSGMHELADRLEIHVVSCTKQHMKSPEKIGPNVWFHQPVVPHLGWGRTGFAGCALAVRKLARQLGVDLAHGQGTERECAVSAVLSGVPNVVTIHGNMEKMNRDGQAFQTARLYGNMISFLENQALRRTLGVFCNSSYTEELVAPRSRRTWRVPNPIQAAFLDTPLAPQPSGIPQILNVGYISPWKRQVELLDEITRLRGKGHEFRMIFAGKLSDTGDYGKAFAQRLEKCEREGFASYAGYLDSKAIMQLMDQCHAMIHCPSEESFGLVAGEGIARGLKFFGTRTGGLCDIASGIPGLELYSDIETLVDEVESWLANGAPREESAREHVIERYHPQVVATRHFEVYSEVLGSV